MVDKEIDYGLMNEILAKERERCKDVLKIILEKKMALGEKMEGRYWTRR